jgi:hypothetical protein
MSSIAIGSVSTPRLAGQGSRASFASTVRLLIPFVLFTLVLLVGKASLLRLAFPPLAALFGYLVYKRNECHFLSFLLWLCMLTPLLRRLVDYKSSYQEQSLILVAPLLLMLLPLIDLRRRWELTAPVIRNTALLALFGITYGAGIGLIKHPGPNVVQSFAMWIAPIAFCIFIASIRDTAALTRTLTSTIAWGVILMALYGMYQFAVAPPWDTYWLRQVTIGSLSPSFGHPEPLGIRVWSTMNSPGSFALFLSAFLIWLSRQEGWLVIIANVLGYLVFCLTLVRTAWMMTALGLLICMIAGRSKFSPKNFVIRLLSLCLIVAGLTYVLQFRRVQDRFKTFTSLKSDMSVNEREEMYQYMEGYILTTPLGDGLQSIAVYHDYLLDSTFIEMFFMLGWIGTALYSIGLLYLLGRMALSLRRVSIAPAAAVAITLACSTQSLSGDILYRQGGVILWLFIGVWACFASSHVAISGRRQGVPILQPAVPATL